MPKRIPISAHDTLLKQRFGATIRRYRRQLAVSQEELAWRAEMHRTYLADVERGVRNLSLTSIVRLVNAIGVSLSEFFGTLESLDLAAAVTTSSYRAPNRRAGAKRKKAKAPARRGRRRK